MLTQSLNITGMKIEHVEYYQHFYCLIQNPLEKPNRYKYFVVHSALMV
jgi:hypothetical protein